MIKYKRNNKYIVFISLSLNGHEPSHTQESENGLHIASSMLP